MMHIYDLFFTYYFHFQLFEHCFTEIMLMLKLSFLLRIEDSEDLKLIGKIGRTSKIAEYRKILRN